MKELLKQWLETKNEEKRLKELREELEIQIYDAMSERHRAVCESKLCVANRIWRIYDLSAISCESELVIREQIRFLETSCYLDFRGNQWHTRVILSHQTVVNCIYLTFCLILVVAITPAR